MKLKILASLITIRMPLGWQVEAQTNVATIVTTNWLTSVPYYREVNGQLYNTERSTLWKEFQADVLDISTNGLLLQTYTFKPVYEASTTSIPTHDYLGSITGYRTVPTTVQVDTQKIPDLKFFLRNYPPALVPAVGQEISFRAMQVGTVNKDGSIFQLWDYGTLHVVMIVTTNYPRAFRNGEKNP
jgi:hypothetical protein